MRTNQTGFGHVLLLVLLVAVAVVGFAAYRVWNNQEAATPATTQTKSTDTLTSASQELDQLGNSLDSSLDASSLDADLDSM